ncbi:rhodanese-like domain-containing protein [Pontibacter qinzhouensis]|uniref:Rhodanese-like domain-containing protein n=1 Tax=Pontibacter qinzhouensis TaxID=2603253 RepID=A0A5C8KC16_9BACT|nr:rhodanese-like domain-containing protein [Pontibacter qinzhouensis]TXK50495.1 rhodanese-like domain-containing protein [Pontibacter qinzhouensis]
MKWIFAIVLIYLTSCAAPHQQERAQANTSLTATAYKEQHAKKKNTVLVDVRTSAEFEEGHLQGAQNADFLSKEFEQQMQHWDKNKTYYLYCASGNRSGKAAKLMEEAGFKHIYNIGGFKELKEAGLPVKHPKP